MENNKKKVMPPARRTSKKTVAKKRVIAVLIAVVLIVGAVAGSTLAWFTDTTDPVVNTFTVGDIDIGLKETTGEEYKMIPGHYVDKNPVVTVFKDSEKSYLFVKLTENLGIWATTPKPGGTNEDTYSFRELLHYELADGWDQLKVDGVDVPGVYYRIVDKNAAEDQEFQVLKDNKVSVDYKVTKEMMAMLDAESKYPTLSVKAYAIQYFKTNDTPFGEAAAWVALNDQLEPEIPVG